MDKKLNKKRPLFKGFFYTLMIGYKMDKFFKNSIYEKYEKILMVAYKKLLFLFLFFVKLSIQVK